MGVIVQNLSRKYQRQMVVNSISFEAGENQILGLLGPNGAGKSTTMKIIVGALSATTGSVLVNGMDVSENALQIKRITGYLAEDNPLYDEMYVHEYLSFVGRLYGLKGQKLKNRVKEMVAQCGLEPEQNKRIEMLSKGYRQRVGIAQVLLHDPSVLILDEPTTGLDPNQILEVRALIKEASKSKTVILSTHILQEAQAICDKVVILNKGKIVIDKKFSELGSGDHSLEKIFERLNADVEV